MMLVIFSSDANKSNHIKREVGQADEGGRPVITFRVEDVEPEGELEYYLDSTHWLDAFPDPAEKHSHLVEAVRRLLAEPTSQHPPRRGRVLRERPPRARPPTWLLVGAALLAAIALIGAWASLRPDETTADFNANATPTGSPAVTPSASTASTATPSPSPVVNSNIAILPTVTPTAPPPTLDDTEAKITQLINELNAPNSTEGARSDVIFRMGPFVDRDSRTHARIVKQLTDFIRARAARNGRPCSERQYKTLPRDLQAALDVLASRRSYYGNDETERLELQDTDLDGAVFKRGGHFEGVRLRNACLNYTIMEGAFFSRADLYGASAKDFSVTETDFNGADLRRLQGFKTEKDLRDWLCVARNVDARQCP